MDLEQIQVGGVKYNIKDSEARSGLTQAEADIADIRDKLSSVGAFNDVSRENITTKCTIDTNKMSNVNIYATKVSGIIIMEINAIIHISPGFRTENLFKINDERFYSLTAGSSTIGTALAFYNESPFIKVGRLVQSGGNNIGIGESNISNGGQLRSQIIMKALHP